LAVSHPADIVSLHRDPRAAREQRPGTVRHRGQGQGKDRSPAALRIEGRRRSPPSAAGPKDHWLDDPYDLKRSAFHFGQPAAKAPRLFSTKKDFVWPRKNCSRCVGKWSNCCPMRCSASSLRTAMRFSVIPPERCARTESAC